MDQDTTTTQSSSSSAADIQAQADRLLQEMQATRLEFDIEAQADADEVEDGIMNLRHKLHVINDAIDNEVSAGLGDINDAGDVIEFDDDETV